MYRIVIIIKISLYHHVQNHLVCQTMILTKTKTQGQDQERDIPR